ncbi:hypothetical protein SBF1_950052 [Candidatus Desulfosporosinus infrequens]|uniref:Uncharacterized protein n=1 Tax=Candidatus Desulfosporosinus infrequens TaxID=2043169 RepID=A0A2U3LY68_9FIRM|nr:hypothetical protein SBF1_950052 [Candidatus Desulfosporosinus infrequens]
MQEGTVLVCILLGDEDLGRRHISCAPSCMQEGTVLGCILLGDEGLGRRHISCAPSWLYF